MRERYYRASDVLDLNAWHNKASSVDATACLYLGFAIGVACSIGPVFSNNDPDKWFVAVAAVFWFALFVVKFVQSIKHDRRKPKMELFSADDSNVTEYPTKTAKD